MQRASIKRDKFTALIAGFVQTVDTVCLSWVLPQIIAGRQPGNHLLVNVYVPVKLYGAIGHERYCQALVDATMGILDPSIGPIRSQIFLYSYVS